mgnify:FL=1
MVFISSLNTCTKAFLLWALLHMLFIRKLFGYRKLWLVHALAIQKKAEYR